jgi:hypothetical protein
VKEVLGTAIATIEDFHSDDAEQWLDWGMSYLDWGDMKRRSHHMIGSYGTVKP